MSFDWERILRSKRAQRQKLAARPVAEKLRTLDAMRECALTLRRLSPSAALQTGALGEEPPAYHTKSTRPV